MGADAAASTKQGRCPIEGHHCSQRVQMGRMGHRAGGDVGGEWITSQWDLDHAPSLWSRVK
eukprot:4131694-Karenia_brevis.AAC.1